MNPPPPPPAACSPPAICVPVLLPLLTLMERSSTTPEGAEVWETNDQGSDIMLRHLEAARDVAHNAHSYTKNAETILQGKKREFILFFCCFSASQFCPFFLLQGLSATRSCWRCLKRISSCGCCGEAGELLSTNRIATTSSTSSSLRCHGNWSRHRKPRR